MGKTKTWVGDPPLLYATLMHALRESPIRGASDGQPFLSAPLARVSGAEAEAYLDHYT